MIRKSGMTYVKDTWECLPCHGAEEFTWTFERRVCFMASDGSTVDCHHCYHSWKPEQQVSQLAWNIKTILALTCCSNIDALFKQHTYLMFPSKSIHTDSIRCRCHGNS
jgi:hypothetical protein